MNRNNEEIVELRQYIYNYFELHANQRFNLFKIYTVFVTVISYGIGYLLIKFPVSETKTEVLCLCLSILFLSITYIFQKLDTRNKELIDNSIKGLVYLESVIRYKSIPDQELENIHIYTYQDNKKGNKPFNNHKACFDFIFIIGYGIGIILSIISIMRIFNISISLKLSC